MSTPSLTTTYRGRFAPSPTGDLHMGSLVAAVASFLEARVRDGEWLLRIEDIDPPREVPGSADRILRALEKFGFEWDGEVLYQSTRDHAYAAAVETLRQKHQAFDCACSRNDVAEHARHVGTEGPVYPGTCRDGLGGGAPRSIRVRAPSSEICFNDLLQGRVCQHVGKDIGDFVVRRADNCYAYQLAVVVDDAWQGITDVVRGVDLLLSTPRQVWLQQLLDVPAPNYLHIPLLLDEHGRKLSKQTRSAPVDPENPAGGLFRALCLLQQSAPAELSVASTDEIWQWAVKHWQPQRLHGLHELSTPSTAPR